MIKRVSTSGLLAGVLLAGIGAAHAEGLYAGGSLGAPDYRTSVNGIGGSGSGASGKVFVGYELAPHVSVEGGLVDLGHIDNGNGKVNLRGAYLDGVAHLALADKLSMLGSVGIAQGRFHTTAGDDSSLALKLGGGLEYALSDRLALLAEYDHYRFTNAFDAKPVVGEFSVGLKVGF